MPEDTPSFSVDLRKVSEKETSLDPALDTEEKTTEELQENDSFSVRVFLRQLFLVLGKSFLQVGIVLFLIFFIWKDFHWSKFLETGVKRITPDISLEETKIEIQKKVEPVLSSVTKQFESFSAPNISQRELLQANSIADKIIGWHFWVQSKFAFQSVFFAEKALNLKNAISVFLRIPPARFVQGNSVNQRRVALEKSVRRIELFLQKIRLEVPKLSQLIQVANENMNLHIQLSETARENIKNFNNYEAIDIKNLLEQEQTLQATISREDARISIGKALVSTLRLQESQLGQIRNQLLLNKEVIIRNIKVVPFSEDLFQVLQKP